VKVCLVSAEYPPHQGGVGDYTRELGAALRRKGVDALVLTSRLMQRGSEAPREGEAPAEPRPHDGADGIPVMQRIGSWGWRAWRELDGALRELSPQVVHIQYQSAAYGLHPAINLWPRRSRWGRRTAVTFHDLRVPYLFPKAGPLRFGCVVELARAAACPIVTNAEDRAMLAPHLSRPPALIPIGSNIRPEPPPGYDRAAWRARAGVAEGETVLAYFGFLNESKGAEELIGALAALRGQGLPVRLWLVGGQVGHSDPTNRAYLARVRERIAALDLESLAHWTGYTPPAQVSANLLAADLCVLPYRDGVSFRRGSLMAALAHGLPVVSTFPRQPLAEIVDGRNMALVPAGDAPALAVRIAALIGDPVARRRLGEGALHLAESFTWDSIAERTVEAYEALVRAPGGQ
jgi:glycosyltransferase involved in cell wall biosynthesis